MQVRGPLCAGDLVLLLHEGEGHWAAGRAVLCEVRGVCDLSVLDALARLALASRRHGTPLRVCASGDHARRLLALTGLDAVLTVEVRGP